MDQSQHEFQRATRIAAAASMGSMVLISAFAAGSSHATASTAESTLSSPVASVSTVPPTVTLASEAVAAQPVVLPNTTSAPACTNAYVVRPGDFWLRLAEEASVSVDALYRANGATADTPLRPGQQVCLPNGVQVVVNVPATAPVKVAPTAPPVTAAKKVRTPIVLSAPPVTAAHTTRSSK